MYVECLNGEGGCCADRLQHAFHIKLSPDLPQHHTVPQEYELDAVAEQVKNTYVFTEQNLPGYKKGSYERDRENNIPAKFRQRDNKFDNRVKEQAGDVKKRKDVDWRKPIPSKDIAIQPGTC